MKLIINLVNLTIHLFQRACVAIKWDRVSVCLSAWCFILFPISRRLILLEGECFYFPAYLLLSGGCLSDTPFPPLSFE